MFGRWKSPSSAPTESTDIGRSAHRLVYAGMSALVVAAAATGVLTITAPPSRAQSTGTETCSAKASATFTDDVDPDTTKIKILGQTMSCTGITSLISSTGSSNVVVPNSVLGQCANVEVSGTATGSSFDATGHLIGTSTINWTAHGGAAADGTAVATWSAQVMDGAFKGAVLAGNGTSTDQLGAACLAGIRPSGSSGTGSVNATQP